MTQGPLVELADGDVVPGDLPSFLVDGPDLDAGVDTNSPFLSLENTT